VIRTDAGGTLSKGVYGLGRCRGLRWHHGRMFSAEAELDGEYMAAVPLIEHVESLEQASLSWASFKVTQTLLAFRKIPWRRSADEDSIYCRNSKPLTLMGAGPALTQELIFSFVFSPCHENSSTRRKPLHSILSIDPKEIHLLTILNPQPESSNMFLRRMQRFPLHI
jgi:hypothetical protein